jgi:hypothetical protein
LLGQRRNLYCIKNLYGQRRCRWRAVVRQRRPWGDKTLVGRNGIVFLTAILAGKSSSVLPLATPGPHLINVQRVDLAREAGPRCWIGGCSFGEQDHHCGRIG